MRMNWNMPNEENSKRS